MEAIDRHTRTGLLIGALAGICALLVSLLMSARGLPFTPAVAGQATIEILPGWLAVPLIEGLKEWAKRLLVIGMVGIFLLCSAFAGRWAIDPRQRTGSVVALAMAPWVFATVAGRLLTGQVDLAASAINAGISSAVFLVALSWLGASVHDAETPPIPGRRRALVSMAGFATLVAMGGVVFGSTIRSTMAKLGDVASAARHLTFTAVLAPEDPELARLAGLTPRITPTKDHYLVDEALIKPSVDVDTWRLEVKGAVDAPFALSYDELLDLDAVEQFHTLECISNEVGGPLISTALWTGVPLRDLLQRARPKSGAFDVVLRSVDDYSDSIPLAKAMDPHTVLAYLMNGRTVPQDHGFPVRALVPDIYGMKNVKWLQAIEVVTFDYAGYWQERGWSDVAIVNTNTRIDVPERSLRWNGGPLLVAGIAFAGARGINKVEVSFDIGKTWVTADLEPAAGPLTWRRWVVRWTPPGIGRQILTARSTDGTGQLQTSTPRNPVPPARPVTTRSKSTSAGVSRGTILC